MAERQGILQVVRIKHYRRPQRGRTCRRFEQLAKTPKGTQRNRRYPGHPFALRHHGTAWRPLPQARTLTGPRPEPALMRLRRLLGRRRAARARSERKACQQQMSVLIPSSINMLMGKRKVHGARQVLVALKWGRYHAPHHPHLPSPLPSQKPIKTPAPPTKAYSSPSPHRP